MIDRIPRIRRKCILANRFAKWLTSLGYASRKAYRKLTTAKPSIFVVAAIIVAFSIFLLGGGIFSILEKPLLAVPFGTSVLFYYPYDLNQQTILESLSVMLLYSLGAVGLLLMYLSTKYAYKPRQAMMLLLVGAIFLLIAYIFVETIIYWKFYPPGASS
jgi:predicted neutral ceramidase superfamily lipid hydrolase